MSTELRDGTIIPSELAAVDTGGGIFGSSAFGNTALRVGEVVEMLYPSNERNLSKKFIEYRVAVQQRDGEGGAVLTIYNNCMLLNGFGGLADKTRHTLRADASTERNGDGLGRGSKVLILCVNGETNQAVILGGVRDENDADLDREEDGHNLYREFNGIGFAIDKFGQLKVQFRGATTIDGKLDAAHEASEENGPTTIEMQKDGSVEVYTKDRAQRLKVDHANKKTEFHFDKLWDVQVNEKVTEKYGAEWECSVGATITIQAEKDIVIKSATGTWTAECAGRSYIKSAGLHVGKATDAFMLGTTYRAAESQLHAKLIASLTALSVQLGLAGGAVVAACGPMPIPVIGPGLATPSLAVAGGALTSSVAIVIQMVTALTAFEAQAPRYLSLKNKND